MSLLGALLAACSSSSGGAHATDAGPSVDATDDASAATADATQDDTGTLSDSSSGGGPPPSEDAPEYGPDGCVLTAIACIPDAATCCEGTCYQGVCTNGPHQAERPLP